MIKTKDKEGEKHNSKRTKHSDGEERRRKREERE
jgi:hypothetical protein